MNQLSKDVKVQCNYCGEFKETNQICKECYKLNQESEIYPLELGGAILFVVVALFSIFLTVLRFKLKMLRERRKQRRILIE